MIRGTRPSKFSAPVAQRADLRAARPRRLRPNEAVCPCGSWLLRDKRRMNTEFLKLCSGITTYPASENPYRSRTSHRIFTKRFFEGGGPFAFRKSGAFSEWRSAQDDGGRRPNQYLSYAGLYRTRRSSLPRRRTARSRKRRSVDRDVKIEHAQTRHCECPPDRRGPSTQVRCLKCCRRKHLRIISL